MIEQNLAIRVILSKVDEKLAKEIYNGIEEEGVPYFVEYINENEINLENINKYAYIESKKSKLNLGIALCKKRAVFHFTKLNESKPLFIIDNLEDSDKKIRRIYGNNIARVVKGVPLKLL